MKKYRRTLVTLALLMLLNGCAANAQTIETEPPTMAATESAVRPAAEESGPPPTEETNPVRESVEETEEASVTEPAVPKMTKPQEPEQQPEREETPPSVVVLTETQPCAEPEITATEATTPESTTGPQIDIEALEAYARSYAQSLGFTIDYGLEQGSAGYYPALDYPIHSMEEGYRVVCGCVSSLKEQLIAADGTVEFAPYRYNCKIEYLYSDEYGDWYLFWDFYG